MQSIIRGFVKREKRAYFIADYYRFKTAYKGFLKIEINGLSE